MAAGGVEGVMKYTRISCSQAEAALALDSMVDSVDSVDSAGERPRPTWPRRGQFLGPRSVALIL